MVTSKKHSATLDALLPILFLGSAAAIQLTAASAFFRRAPDMTTILLAFLMTSGIYLLNRITDHEDKFNNLPRWQFFNGSYNRTYLWGFTSVLFIGSPVIFSLLLQQHRLALLFGMIAACGVIYSVKIIPSLSGKDLRLVSLKDIPILKNIIVCAIWAGSALLLAAVTNNISCFRPDVLTIFATFFICTLNSTVACDARDTEGDRMRDIRTLPVLIGPENTFRLLSVISAAGILGITTSGLTGMIGLPVVMFTSLCIIWAWLTTIPQYKGIIRVSKGKMEFLIDSHLILTPFGLGLFYFF